MNTRRVTRELIVDNRIFDRKENQEMKSAIYEAELVPELADLLEDKAIEVHVLRRDFVISSVNDGHQGSYKECPAYQCIKARHAITKAKGLQS